MVDGCARFALLGSTTLSTPCTLTLTLPYYDYAFEPDFVAAVQALQMTGIQVAFWADGEHYDMTVRERPA